MVKSGINFYQCLYPSIVTISMMSWQSVIAAEWSVEPSISARTNFNNNVWVSEKSKNQILDVRIKPSLKFNRESENSLLSLETSWAQKKYISKDDETRGLFGAKIDFKKEWSKQLFQVDAAYIEISTINSETTDGNKTLIETIRTEKKITPLWRTLITSNFSLDLSMRYSSVEFEKTEQQWFDYRNISPSLTGIYQITENLQWNIATGASRYELADFDYAVDSLFLQTGVRLGLNEISNAGLVLGAQRIHSELKQISQSNDTETIINNSAQFTLEADYGLTFEKGNISFMLSRNLTPTSQGNVQYTDQGQILTKYSWSENLFSSLKLSAEKRDNINNASNTANQYKTIATHVRTSWQKNENWRLTLSYRWLIRKYDRQNTWIDSHKITLSTRYVWDKKVFSHK